MVENTYFTNDGLAKMNGVYLVLRCYKSKLWHTLLAKVYQFNSV